MIETWSNYVRSPLFTWKYAILYDKSRQQNSSYTTLRERLASRAVIRIALATSGLLALSFFLWLERSVTRDFWIGVPPSIGPPPSRETLSVPGSDVDWTQFAYCQYVTNEEYLCNSMMVFESLTRLESKAERLMMFPEQWKVGGSSRQGRLLAKARDEYGVRLVPIHVQHFDGETTWADSFTKLLAFNQTRYQRVLSLDSDATVLKPMDELFLLPSAPVAMPRAYWLDEFVLSSQLILIEPSDFEFRRIEAAFESRGSQDFDMEIVNQLYGDSCFIIPHRRYDLLSGEFRSKSHHKYLGSKEETWDPDRAFEEAKFLHFSDWPFPKPWKHAGQGLTKKHQPECTTTAGEEDCRNRDRWLWLYSDFRERRKMVCEA